MMRGDDFQFPRRFLKSSFKLIEFMHVDQFFFYGEVIRCPESADDDPIIFKAIR